MARSAPWCLLLIALMLGLEAPVPRILGADGACAPATACGAGGCCAAPEPADCPPAGEDCEPVCVLCVCGITVLPSVAPRMTLASGRPAVVPVLAMPASRPDRPQVPPPKVDPV
jgi:hypothetical protein